jgi:8-oxo-dGTP pyrophosphatase MutT (NUDIX family)
MFRPEVTVAAICESNGRFLLVEERAQRRRLFNQPAGHVERNETLIAAAVREAREESAWLFAPSALIGVYLWRSPTARRPFLRLAFAGTVSDHRPAQPLDHGIVTTHWLSIAELQRRRARLRSPLVLYCIADYLRGVRHDLTAVAAFDRRAALAALRGGARRCAGIRVTAVDSAGANNPYLLPAHAG